MVTVRFTAHLQRHIDCPHHEVEAATLGEALEQVFARNPQARGYILDDQGALRQQWRCSSTARVRATAAGSATRCARARRSTCCRP